MRSPGSGAPAAEHERLARKVARDERVPVRLFLALVTWESGWRADAVSRAGATGLTQLMPGTAALLGVDPADPEQNLRGGARYLRQQFDRFGSWELALAAYNAGPGNVARHGGIPPFPETQAYVREVLVRARRKAPTAPQVPRR